MGLPLEIILAIAECALANTQAEDRHRLYKLMAVNRAMYAFMLERLYRTVIIHHSRMTNKFIEALDSSPKLAATVVNLWVATFNFEAFSYQLGSSPNTILRILVLTPNLRRLALPSQYFPRLISPGSTPPIEHLMVSEDAFPPSTPDIPTLRTIHVYGPLWPTRVETIISRCPNLIFVICTIPYSSQTYVTPAAQCASTLLTRLPSLVSIEFVSSKRVLIALQQFLASYVSVLEDTSRIIMRPLALGQDSPCQKWSQECDRDLLRRGP